MRKKLRKDIIYVLSALKEQKLISLEIKSKNSELASEIFFKEFQIRPQIILGPFNKRNSKVEKQTIKIKFLDNTFKKALYNDWLVNAFPLSEPVDHAYLVFIKRTDDKNMPFPKGTITVPISNLRLLNE